MILRILGLMKVSESRSLLAMQREDYEKERQRAQTSFNAELKRFDTARLEALARGDELENKLKQTKETLDKNDDLRRQGDKARDELAEQNGELEMQLARKTAYANDSKKRDRRRRPRPRRSENASTPYPRWRTISPSKTRKRRRRRRNSKSP